MRSQTSLLEWIVNSSTFTFERKMSFLKHIIKKAKDYYFNEWRGNENVCPAFGEKVYLTELGWRHIAKHPRRLLVDKIIRLKNLKLARELLETSTTYQTLKIQGRYYLYGFRAIKQGRVIKVVVSSRGKRRRKLLYSVMFKSLKRQEQRKIERYNKKIIAEFRKQRPQRLKRRR